MQPPATGSDGGDPRLSVVMAVPQQGEDVDEPLRALAAALEGIPSEVLLVHRGEAPPRGATAGDVRRVAAEPDALVPVMWARGYEASQAPAVAFTTSHVAVTRGWARGLLAALGGGAAGAGGPIQLRASASPLDRAIHLLRYSSFSEAGEPGPVEEIPGDNAAYRREVLDRHRRELGDGVWDVELHRHMREEGERLAWVPSATALGCGSYRAAPFLRQRFRHGARFGGFRRRELGMPLWRILLAVPVVPAVLAARSLEPVRSRSDALLRSLPAVPWLLLSAVAWALGEGWGALRPGPESVPVAAERP